MKFFTLSDVTTVSEMKIKLYNTDEKLIGRAVASSESNTHNQTVIYWVHLIIHCFHSGSARSAV